jgi:hypothetical protein
MAMRIELPITGLSKAKRSKVDGLVEFNDTNNIATFEWGADADQPHDYATAFERAKADVEDAGGKVTGEPRIVG